MDTDSTSPDPANSFARDPKIIAAMKAFTAALDATTPDWRSHLSSTDKFISGHRPPIDASRLNIPPQWQ